MRLSVMFITAVCVLFLVKLRWPKKKSIYDMNLWYERYDIIHTPTVVQGGGGGVDGTPLLGFCCITIFWKDFTFNG